MTAVHRCKRCGLPVRWVTTALEKSQALDPLPRKDGTVVIVAGVAITLTKAHRGEVTGDLWMPHAATCPKGRPVQPQKAVGLTAITGLSFVDEADRLARGLMKAAEQLVKRTPDERDCDVAWPYFKQWNPGIDPNVIPLLRPRVRQIIAERQSQGVRA